MAAFSNPLDAFYDDRNSPRNYRNQLPNRQAGGADPYASMSAAAFGAEAPMPSIRYDSMRDGFGTIQNTGAGNAHFPYDASAAQTWSGGGASLAPFGNGMGNMAQNGNYGPSRSIKPSRGRVGLQQVSSILGDALQTESLTSRSFGTISLNICSNNILPSWDIARVHLAATTCQKTMMSSFRPLL